MFGRHSALSLTLASCLAIACSASEQSEGDGGQTGGGGEDTRFHAPTNGVHISEMDACDALRSAFQDKALFLKCSKTVRTCPNFVRAQYDPDCVEFDQGSVQGCVDYYASQMSCNKLVETDCVVTVYPGSEPAGCP